METSANLSNVRPWSPVLSSTSEWLISYFSWSLSATENESSIFARHSSDLNKQTFAFVMGFNLFYTNALTSNVFNFGDSGRVIPEHDLVCTDRDMPCIRPSNHALLTRYLFLEQLNYNQTVFMKVTH